MMMLKRGGGLHVEADGVGEHGCDEVCKNEVCPRGFLNEVEGHDGHGGAGFEPEEGWEGDGSEGERGEDDGMGPCEMKCEYLVEKR